MLTINILVAGAQLHFPEQVKAFYKLMNKDIFWLHPANRSALDSLSTVLSRAPEWGLEKKDYLYEQQIQFNTAQDSVWADMIITDEAMHFLHDISKGNREVPLAYNGLSYRPANPDLANWLFEAVTSEGFQAVIEKAEPKSKAYHSVKNQMKVFLQIVSVKGFSEIKITSQSPGYSNHQVVERLRQLGFIANDSSHLPDRDIKLAVQQAQKFFCLLNDGTLRSTAIKEFNVPISTRISELASALNTLRWLNDIQTSASVAIVNIPSASLILYVNGNAVMASRIIAGKPTTPTPTLCSTITELVLYPYWNVPNKIAIRELLPEIKRNRAYLATNNFQILNKSGRVVNPFSIDWSTLNAHNFPYRIRQSTGCDNSLGLIKLNFYSPFDVYLHDTPWKILFSLNNRYFSHGCMRLEKAKELGHYLLNDNAIAIDTLDETNCLKNKEPVTVKAEKPIPIFVVYQTAWADSSGRLQFYRDPYKKVEALSK